jgi:hypothetical protein
MKKIHSHQPKSFRKKSFFTLAFVVSIMVAIMFLSLSSSLNAQQDTLSDSFPVGEPVPLIDTVPTTDTIDLEIDDKEYIDEDTTPAAADGDVLTFIPGEYTTHQKRRGERLFNGLTPFQSGMHNCASCHYLEAQEEMNWNPSAYELAQVWQENPEYDLMQKMNSPITARLIEDHAGMTINAEEAHLLEAYYTQLNTKEKPELQAYPVKSALFWGMGILMFLAVVDLLFTRKIKYKAIHIIVLFAGIGIHGQIVVIEAQALGRTQDYAPDQPIKFSHLIHSGENEIDCKYCHFTADYSQSANIPSNNVCLNCHNVVRTGTNSGSFEINKIHKAVATGQPIEWIRIHKLPDHSVFNHAQHVNAGQLDCAECHGEVETMHIVRQVEDLSMGWCLDCHRTTNVDFLDNPYYEMYGPLHEKIRNGEIDGVTAAELGGEDCMNCHH